MAYYLQWSASSGSATSNKELLQIHGITGALSSISYKVKSNAPSYNVPRYIFDIRRSLDSTTSGGGVGYILQFNPTGVDSSGTSNHKINGVSATPLDFFNNYLVDDVLSFDVNSTPSGGVIAFGARFNEVEHSYGLAVSEIVVTDAAGVHTINMSSSGGAGTSVTSDTGNLTAKLFNFPTDNSQWIFYSEPSAGVTADVAYTVSSPSVSGSASATVKAPQSDIAFSVSKPSVSASTSASLPNPVTNVNVIVSSPSVSVASTATLPQPASDIDFTVNTPSVTANASATLPGYNATVSFTVSAPSVSADASATLPNPSADVSYTVSPPSIDASASATLPNPVSDVAFSVSAPSVSVSALATEPNFNANVAFTINAPAVSISASATLPQPESTVNFTVSPPNISVVAIVGGIAIIVDDETNINQRVLSTNINAQILSTNING